MAADLPSAQSSSAEEALSAVRAARVAAEAAISAGRIDRPDAHCPDCPFSDRGDWVMYRAEFEALVEARENANAVSVRVEAENRRLREATSEWLAAEEAADVDFNAETEARLCTAIGVVMELLGR